MRLSFSKQHDIKQAIVKDLYDPPTKKIDKQKGALVLRNHTEWVGKYMPIIKQLPIEMIHTSDRIKVTIPALEPEFDQSNPSNIEAHEKCHETTWSQYVDSGLPTMMKGSGWNAEDIPIPIQEGMEEDFYNRIKSGKAWSNFNFGGSPMTSRSSFTMKKGSKPNKSEFFKGKK